MTEPLLIYYEDGYGFAEKRDENGYASVVLEIESGVADGYSDPAEAIPALEQLRPEARGRFDADVVAAICAYKIGEYEKAYELGKGAVEVAEKVPGFDPKKKLSWANIHNRPYIRALGIAGAALVALKRKKEAKGFFDRAKAVYPRYEMNTRNAEEMMAGC